MDTELPEQNRFPNTDSRNEIPLVYHAFHFLTERWLNDKILGDLAYGKQCYNFL